jgi:hypothetical protein
MKMRPIMPCLILLTTLASAQTQADPWQPFRFFVGKWQGTAAGKAGLGKVEREYRFVLNDRFLEVRNRSVYPAQQKNPKGEVHEDIGLISQDNQRKKAVLRQFHVEGFVNQYALETASQDGKWLVFVSEAIENIPPGWRAREAYSILGPDEFVEEFALAEPGKNFELYTKNHFKRKN